MFKLGVWYRGCLAFCFCYIVRGGCLLLKGKGAACRGISSRTKLGEVMVSVSSMNCRWHGTMFVGIGNLQSNQDTEVLKATLIYCPAVSAFWEVEYSKFSYLQSCSAFSVLNFFGCSGNNTNLKKICFRWQTTAFCSSYGGHLWVF